MARRPRAEVTPAAPPSPAKKRTVDRWIVPVLAALALGAVVARLRKDPEDAATAALAPPPQPRAIPTELRFSGAQASLYDVTWTTSSTMALAQTGPASTSIDLAARVEVFDAGRDGERRLVGLRIVRLEKARTMAFEKDLFPDEAAQRRELEGKEVILAMDARGTVEHVYVPSDATDLAKNLLQPLALHFAMTLPESDAGVYVATEQSDYGPMVWAYTVRDGALRKTAREPDVTGEAEIELASGFPSRITMTATTTTHRGEQGATSAKSSFAATRTDAAGGASPRAVDLARFARHAPGERPTDIDERAANLALANGMTIEDIIAMIGAHSSGKDPQKGHVMRAAALLLAKPELCDEVAKPFSNDAIGDRGRQLIIDLLSSSGDAKAQAVLRALLASPAAQHDRSQFEQLIQRFSLVMTPEAESISFVREEWLKARRTKERRLRQATAYTLGSLAGHAHSRSRDALALPVVNELLSVLRATKDEDEERGLIAALGNAGMVEGLPSILERAGAKDNRTRTQVATSLRKFDTPPIREKLLDLLGDPDPQVALSAVRSLDIQRIGTAELASLADRIEAQKVHADADATLLGVVMTHVADKALVLRILRALQLRAEERPELLVQVEKALASLEGQPQQPVLAPPR